MRRLINRNFQNNHFLASVAKPAHICSVPATRMAPSASLGRQFFDSAEAAMGAALMRKTSGIGSSSPVDSAFNRAAGRESTAPRPAPVTMPDVSHLDYCGNLEDSLYRLLNEQVGHELNAAERYESIAIYLERLAAPKPMVDFMRRAASEEREHADAFRKMIVQAGAVPATIFPQELQPLNFPECARGTSELIGVLNDSINEVIMMERGIAGKVADLYTACKSVSLQEHGVMKYFGSEQISHGCEDFIEEQLDAERELQAIRNGLLSLGDEPELADVFERCEQIFATVEQYSETE